MKLIGQMFDRRDGAGQAFLAELSQQEWKALARLQANLRGRPYDAFMAEMSDEVDAKVFEFVCDIADQINGQSGRFVVKVERYVDYDATVYTTEE